MSPNRIRRGLTASAVAIACVVALTPAASAGAKPVHDSTITTEGFDYSRFPTFDVYGFVTSTSKKCIANRRVKVLFGDGPNGPYEVVDTARTSDKGTWAGSGDVTPDTFGIKAIVTRSTFGPKHHKQVCGAATSNVVSAAG